MSANSSKKYDDDKIEYVLNYISDMIRFRSDSIFSSTKDYLSLSDYALGFYKGSLAELEFIENLLKS